MTFPQLLCQSPCPAIDSSAIYCQCFFHRCGRSDPSGARDRPSCQLDCGNACTCCTGVFARNSNGGNCKTRTIRHFNLQIQESHPIISIEFQETKGHCLHRLRCFTLTLSRYRSNRLQNAWRDGRLQRTSLGHRKTATCSLPQRSPTESHSYSRTKVKVQFSSAQCNAICIFPGMVESPLPLLRISCRNAPLPVCEAIEAYDACNFPSLLF